MPLIQWPNRPSGSLISPGDTYESLLLKALMDLPPHVGRAQNEAK